MKKNEAGLPAWTGKSKQAKRSANRRTMALTMSVMLLLAFAGSVFALTYSNEGMPLTVMALNAENRAGAEPPEESPVASVLTAAVAGDLPEGSHVTYQWQRSAVKPEEPVYDSGWIDSSEAEEPDEPPLFEGEDTEQPPVLDSGWIDFSKEENTAKPPIESEQVDFYEEVNTAEAAMESEETAFSQGENAGEESSPDIGRETETPAPPPLDSGWADSPADEDEEYEEEQPLDSGFIDEEELPDDLIWQDIPGATGKTYTLTPDDKGMYIRVRIFVEPPRGRMVWRSEPLGAVSNAVLVVAATDGSVIYVGTNGDDNKNGFTEADRVLTMNAAFDKVREGGTIYVVGTAGFIQEPNNFAIRFTKSCSVEAADINKKSVVAIRQRLFFTGSTITFKNITLSQVGPGLTVTTGAAIDILGGNLVLDNAVIDKSSYSTVGVLGISSGGTITMKNGTKILNSGHIANGVSKPIVAVNKGTLVMEPGSEIRACNGAAVQVAQGQSFEMRGGTITGNRTLNNSYAVTIADNPKLVKIGGNAVISGNSNATASAANLYLGRNASVAIQPNLTSAAKIGVTPESTAASGTIVATGATESNAGCLVMENWKAPYKLERQGDKLVFVNTNTVYVKAGTGKGEGTKENPFTSLKDAAAVPSDGMTVKLLSDISVAERVLLDKAVVLQGRDENDTSDVQRTITRAPNYKGAVIEVTKGTASLRGIQVDGAGTSAAAGPLLHVNGSTAQVVLEDNSALVGNDNRGALLAWGTLTMKPGSEIKSNRAPDDIGDGIYVSPGATLNFEGGTVGDPTLTGESDIYGGGKINISGAPKVANIFLPAGKSLALTGALTGSAGSIGVTIEDEPSESLGNVRIIASDSAAEADAGKFVCNNTQEESDPNAPPAPQLEVRRNGTNLVVVKFSREARLKTLERGGFLSAGEVKPESASDFKGTAGDATSIEEVRFTIPYSVNTPTTVNVTAKAMDAYATIQSGSTSATGKPLLIPIPYDPARLAAGDSMKPVIVTVTSQHGADSKRYEVTIVRGAPQLTGNNTLNVSFAEGSSDAKEHFITIDSLRANGVDVSRFAIRVENADGTAEKVTGLTPIRFNNATGELHIRVTNAYAVLHTSEVNPFVSAGREKLSLWIDGVQNLKLGIFEVNMTITDTKTMAAFTEISHLDWGEVYPKSAYIRAEDKPKEPNGVESWPMAGQGNLMEEDVFGNWGKIVNGDFVLLYKENDQIAHVRPKLETYALEMLDAKLKQIAAKHGILLPRYRLELRENEYKPAKNAVASLPNGQIGLYEFRVDIALLNDNGSETNIKVAGTRHSIRVVPKMFDGISEDSLYEALQNDGGTGALDGTFSGRVWVRPDASAADIQAAIEKEFLEKTGSVVRRRMEWLTSQPDYKDYTLNPQSALLENDGLNYIFYVSVAAYKTDCPKYEEVLEDGSSSMVPEPRYITTALVPVVLKVDVLYHKTEARILVERAASDIRAALDGGKLTFEDMSSALEPTKSEAAMATYVSDKALAAVTTPAGTVLASGLDDGTFVTLEAPLRDMITLSVGSRAFDESAFLPAVDGTPGNSAGVTGQYVFALSVTAKGSAVAASVQLDFSGVSVSPTSSGGSAVDDGIALLPKPYYSGGSNGSNGSNGSSGTIWVDEPQEPEMPATAQPSAEKTTAAPLKPEAGGTAEESISVIAPPPSNSGKLSEAENVKITVVQSDKITAVLPDMEALIRAVLTPEEIKAAKGGEKVEIQLTVDLILPDSAEALQGADYARIKAEAEKNKLSVGAYLDIKLGKRIADGDWIAVTEAGEAIRMTVDILPELLKEGRIFSIARAHGGEVSILPNLSNDGKAITFETDRFSAYAIVYSNSVATNQGVKRVALWGGGVLLAAAAALGVVLLVKRRKSDRE